MSDAELWDAAQAAEHGGELHRARKGYTALVDRLSAAGQDVPPYLLERLAVTLTRLHDFEPARTFLEAARRERDERGDSAGALHLSLQQAQLELAALQPDAARRILAAALGTAEPHDAEGLAKHIGTFGSDAAAARALAPLRVEAWLTLGRCWAAEGSLGPASLIVRRALTDFVGAERRFSRTDTGLFLAEILLDLGDPSGAEAVEGAWAPTSADAPGGAAERWRLLRARRQRMLGDLGGAKRTLLALGPGDGTGPPSRIELLAGEALAQVLTLLNRVSEAETLLEGLLARLGGEAPDARWRQRLGALREQARARRGAADEELAPPFAPELLWSAATGELHEREGTAPPAGGFAPSERTSERFADEVARQANLLLAALAQHDGSATGRALVALGALGMQTDSPQLRARVRYHRGLVEYYTGDPRACLEDLLPCLAHAAARGLRLDEWQYARLASWAAARCGDLAGQESYADRAARLFDGILAELHFDDRVFARRNKSSAEEEWVATRVRRLAWLPPSRFPLAWLRRWLDDRHFQREAGRLYEAVRGLSGWQPTGLPEDGHAPAQAAGRPQIARTGSQVERWVQAQLRARRRPTGWLARVLAARPPATTVCLHYDVLAEAVICFRRFRGRLAVFSLPVTRIALDEAVRDLIDAVRSQEVGGPARFARRAERVARMLRLDLVLDESTVGATALDVVPNDVLVNVPFAALPLRGAYLCEHLVVRITPTLGLLPRRRSWRARAPQSFLGVATSGVVDGIPTLPGATGEVAAIATLLQPTMHIRTLLEDAADPADVLEALRTSQWAHFACHGVFDRDDPHRSGLVLAGAEAAARRLTIEQVQGRQLPLDLVVLSACWSASAAVLPGNELVSLPAAFLRAGTRNVVGSWWPVRDDLAQALIERLYADVLRLGPAAALAAVQRAWARSNDPARRTPAAWAGFACWAAG